MLEAIVAELGPITWAQGLAMSGTMAVAGFVMGFLGFGASIIVVIVVSQIWGPILAVPLATIASLPAVVQLMPTAIRHADRSFVIPYGIAALIAAPLGTWVLVSVDPALLKIAISVLVLGMVAMLYSGWKPAQPLGTPGVVIVGMAASMVQGAAGVGGPPAVAIALSRGGTPERTRANVIGALIVLNMSAVPPLFWFGLVTPRILIFSLALLPIYCAFIWLGSRYFSDSGHGHYRKGALLGLAVIGLITLGLSAHDYLGV